MPKNLLLTLAALLAWGGLTAPAGAQTDGLYLAPKLGVSFFTGNNSIDYGGGREFSKRGHSTSFAGALALGYDFVGQGIPLRTELEFTLRAPFNTENNYDYHDGATGRRMLNQQRSNIHTLMFNTFVDLHNDSAFTPYIGAGLGLAFVKGKNRYSVIGGDPFNQGTGNEIYSREASASDRKFAWSLAGGGAWELTSNVSLDLGYRYFHFNNLNMGNHSRSTYQEWVLNPGDGSYDLVSMSGNDPSARARAKRVGLHEVMLGLRITAD